MRNEVVFEILRDKIYIMSISNKKRGFTVMELLVSLAIIAMLFTITMALVGPVKEKSRDSRRMSDVREINKALVLYADNNSKFPIATTAVTITGNDAVSTILESAGVISEVPTDPTHPTNSYTYLSDSSGNTFIISFCLETDTIPNYSKGCGNTINP
jgi:prepilin-type N-terminal cleavage/methylation domain-containing protein